MTLLASRRDPVLAVCGLLLVWPFVFDTVLTFIRRLLRGENVLRAHRSHLYQRFVIAGWSHRRATVVYASLSALGAASAMLLTVRVPLAPLVTGLSIGIAATTMYARLLQLERRTQQPAVAER